MQGKIRLRLAVLAALAALVAVIVPATLASADDPVTGDPTVMLLKLGAQNEVTWGTDTQAITTKRNKCTPVTFASSPQLLITTPSGGALGYTSGSLGVASSGEGNSGKCAQVNADASEGLSIKLGSELDGYAMNAVDLDLELKFNAEIHVTYKLDGATVDTDTFNGMGSDDGPDSADGDNYRYNSLTEGIVALFDEIELVPSNGAFSLEAGGDGTENGDLATNAFSQFRVVPVYDGDITCGDTVDVGSLADLGILGAFTMHALDLGGTGTEFDSGCTQLKFYFDGATNDSLSFIPVLADTNARYTVDAMVEDQAITVDSTGMITSLIAVYNTDGDLTFPGGGSALKACNFAPVLGGSDYTAFWEQDSPVDDGVLSGGSGDNTGVNILPAGEIACFYSAAVSPTGPGVGTETWGIYFEDDPGLGFR
ncbi:MAG: hypothetical protein WCE80_06055 [Acidimicrobiia bacterium]